MKTGQVVRKQNGDIVASGMIYVYAHYPDTGYLVAMLQTVNGSYTLRGKTPIAPPSGVEVVVSGKLQGDEIRFVALRIVDENVIGKQALETLNGVGAKTAELIYSTWGDQFSKYMTEEELVTIKGIGQKTARKIVDSWKRDSWRYHVIRFGMEYGLTTRQAMKAWSAYNERFYEIVKENPYKLTEVGIPFANADAAARKAGIKPDDPRRINAAMSNAIRRGVRKHGHTLIPHGKLMHELGAIAPDLVRLNGKLTEPDFEANYTVINGKYFADKHTFENERFLSAFVKERAERMRSVGDIGDDPFLGFELTIEQEQAIQMLARYGFSVLTGPPGTGKTTILRSLANRLEPLGVHVVFTATTGKAARRLAEATGRDAHTIHKMLASASRNGENIHADLLIIDEASMMDVDIFSDLVDRIGGAHIALVGDGFQLPPVGGGQIFRDIVMAKAAPYQKLTSIMRQSENSAILDVMMALRDKKPIPADPGPGYIWLPQERDAYEQIAALAVEVKRSTGKAPMVIAPYLRYVNALNRKLQERLNQNKANEIIDGLWLAVGDPVRHLQNDYKLGVMNGEVGVVSAIHHYGETTEVIVDFGDREVSYVDYDLVMLKLAYAITVHASQGDQYDHVIVLMPPANDFVTSELAYTAVSRAKRQLHLVCSKYALTSFSQAKARLALRTTGFRYFLNGGQL